MSLFRLPTNLYATFPQELIDKVIESLDLTDLQTFRACSLVARSWTHTSWANLFRSLSITSWDMLYRWCLNTTAGPDGPASYVRSLTFDEMRGKWITPDLLWTQERHLRSFKNVVCFTATGLQINYFFDDSSLSQCFGLFSHGVKEVRLLHPRGSPRIVATFIQQFPKIRRLSIELYSETWSPAPDREEYTSVGFTGALQLVSDPTTDRPDRQLFVFYLIKFPVLYKEVSVVGSLGHSWQYQSLFRACSKTLKKLRVLDVRPDPVGEHDSAWVQGISLSPLHQPDHSSVLSSRRIQAPGIIYRVVFESPGVVPRGSTITRAAARKFPEFNYLAQARHNNFRVCLGRILWWRYIQYR